MIRFKPPVQLLATVEQVIEKHPFALSGAIVETPRTRATAQLLWDDLLGRPRAELSEAVSALSKANKRLLLYTARARIEHDGVTEVLASIFADGNVEGFSTLAWLGYVLSGGHTAFKAETKHAFMAADATLVWQGLKDAANPVAFVARNYRDSGHPFQRWSKSATPLFTDSLVIGEVKRAMLLPLNLRYLVQREGTAVVLKWAKELLNDADRVAWFVSYMATVPSSDWNVDDMVLHEILNRFEAPENKRPFWDSVPKPSKDAFTLWVREAELTELLVDSERLKFWLRFLPHLKKSIKSRCGEAVLLNFGPCFAVQFIEWGHGTYIFPKSEFRDLSVKRSGLYSAVLRKKNEGYSIGDYKHQGYNWQINAAQVVRDVLKERG